MSVNTEKKTNNGETEPQQIPDVSPPILPKRIDFKILREERQNMTNEKITEQLINGDGLQYEYVNVNELERTANDAKLEREGLVELCKNNRVMSAIVSGRIAKKSSRQGTKDETLQISVCNEVAQYCGINIQNLSVNAYRATKTGEICSETEIKTRNIEKHMCLKSFDGKISGKMAGWIFAKVVYGSGGHQDNVFEEADILCEWVRNHYDNFGENTVFVVLIDTDLVRKLETLKNKYCEVKNILIMNHYEFQEYILQTYL